MECFQWAVPGARSVTVSLNLKTNIIRKVFLLVPSFYRWLKTALEK